MPRAKLIQIRSGTAAEWAAANPILARGELGLDLTNALFKIGNGATPWNSLLGSTLGLGSQAGSAPSLEGPAGDYWAPPAIRAAVAGGAGILYTKRIWVPTDQAIDRIGAMVTAVVVGSTLTLGAYFSDAAGDAPSSLFFDAGTIDGNSATAQEIVTAQTFVGGRYYWLACLIAGGGPTVRMDQGTGGVGDMGRHVSLAAATGTTLVNQGRFRSGVVGTALPNPAATTTLLSAMPTIAFRLA